VFLLFYLKKYNIISINNNKYSLPSLLYFIPLGVNDKKSFFKPFFDTTAAAWLVVGGIKLLNHILYVIRSIKSSRIA
jgi:hypothetical protein